MINNQNVPKLRFKEFSGEWNTKKLNEVTTYVDYRGKSPQKSESGIFLVTAKNIKKGFIDYESSKEYVLEEDYQEIMKRGKPQIGDVLLTTEAPLGNVAQIDNENIALAQRVIKFSGKDNLDNTFLKHYFLSDKFQNLLESKAIGTTVLGIQGKVLHQLPLQIPEKSEQQKIASFLSAIDTKIDQLTRKKELFAQCKKGVMQKIFSQELRFKANDGSEFSEWEEKKLGELSFITTGSSNREDSSLDGDYTFFDRSEDIRTSSIFLFDGEAVIIAGEGQKFIPKYFIGKFDLHQRTYAIMQFNSVVGKFIFYYIHQNQNYFLSQAVGSTVKSLRLPMFQTMPIKVPCIEEQTKIANFLSAIDTKIDLVTKQLDEAKNFKKGLLQQMFV
jgi:type I restriction enzyme, S subunit